MRRFYNYVLICTLILWGSIVIPSEASNGSILGLSSRASAMGGAMTAIANDYTATYYNPARLGLIMDNDEWFQTGISIIHTARDFSVTDTTGGGVLKDPSTKGIGFGATIDLERAAGISDCTFGINFYLPSDALIAYYIPGSPSEYYFPIYENVGKGMNGYMGLAYNISEKLSIGIGGNLIMHLPNLDTHIIFFIDTNELLSDPDTIYNFIRDGRLNVQNSVAIQAGVNCEMVLDTGLVAGLAFDPMDWLHFGISYRQTLASLTYGNQYLYITPVDEEGNIQSDLASRIAVFKLPVSYYLSFTPSEYIFGMGINISKYLIGLDITYSSWSEYKGAHMEDPPEAFSDTWNPSMGLEYAYNAKLTLWGGYAWRPSPIPEQNWETNYLNGDTHVLSCGGAYSVGKGSIQIHLQYHLMEKKDVDKEGDMPDIYFKGDLWNTGINYVVTF